MAGTKIAVVVFPGSNCDRDVFHAAETSMGFSTHFHWYGERVPDAYHAVLLPGGFSYGDYLRAGALAKLSPTVESLHSFIDQGKPVLGICNGFQILVEAGFLPGALTKNESLQFQCEDVQLEVASNRSIFLDQLEIGEELTMPIAHSEGRYVCDEDMRKKLEDQDQVALRYKENVNGSVSRIAGITNRKGNVMGLMPHPDRCAESLLENTDGLKMFHCLAAHL